MHASYTPIIWLIHSDISSISSSLDNEAQFIVFDFETSVAYTESIRIDVSLYYLDSKHSR